jgi:DNA processing protein
MRHNGFTIAVLGTPLDHSYPPENHDRQRTIAHGHLPLSQVPFLRYDHMVQRDRKAFFPERNATMAALSEATLIVEAGDRSGALIQARHALRQGRKLFVLDECCNDATLTWPTKFLRQGAIRIADFDDIQAHLATVHPPATLDH